MTKFVFALVLILGTAATSAFAQTTPSRLEEVIKSGNLRVCMTGDYKPFTFLRSCREKPM